MMKHSTTHTCKCTCNYIDLKIRLVVMFIEKRQFLALCTFATLQNSKHLFTGKFFPTFHHLISEAILSQFPPIPYSPVSTPFSSGFVLVISHNPTLPSHHIVQKRPDVPQAFLEFCQEEKVLL